MDEEFQEFLAIFREESLERLVRAAAALDALRQGAGDPAVALEEVDRELHTVKGSARLLGFELLGALVHQMEEVARAYRAAPGRGLPLLIEAVDRLSALVEQVGAEGQDRDDPELRARLAAFLGGDDPGGGASAPPAPPAGPAGPTAPAQGPGGASPPAPAGPAQPPSPPQADSGPAGPTAARPPGPEPEAQEGPPLEGAPLEVASSRRSTRRHALGEAELVRVRAGRLAALDEIVSDLSLTHLRLSSHEGELRRLHQAVTQGKAAAEDIALTLHQVLTEFDGDATQVRRSAETLQRLAVDVRLRPVEALFDHFPREVRELGRRLGKQVRVRLHGADTEIDRVILDHLKAPLTHLLRNAIDHGIEAPEERRRQGKAEEGELLLSAGQEGGQVVIRIADDGRGIDPGELRRVAVRRGVLSAEAAQAITDEEAVELVFRAGFSTRSKASEISGRGVGMDAVRSSVEQLGGEVRLSSAPGRGTAAVIRLPLTQLVTRATFVRSGGQQFAISTESIQESLRLPSRLVGAFAGQEAVVLDGRSVPLTRLGALLGQRVLPDGSHLNLLVLRHADELLALAVEELLEESPVVVKPLGWPLERVRGLAGAVRLPSGEVALLLSAAELVALARGGPVPSPAGGGERARRTILVVDDSIVSRQMVGRYVEALGFDLILAVDGLDAWGILERVTPDLIVTDVEMPRLGGLALTRRLRSDARFSGIPVVVVSTRGSDADRQAGLEAGADAYLTKAEVSEKVFRTLVERLL